MSQIKIKTSQWIVFGTLLFIFFLFTRAPAEWGAWLLTRQPGLAMSGISGSLWKGQANLANITMNGQSVTLDKLQWDIRLLSLLKLSLCVKLNASGQSLTFDGTLCTKSGGVEVSDADVRLPASLLQSKLPFPINGNISAHLNELQIKGDVLLKLNGKGSWTEAQVNNQTQWIELGSFAAEFTDNALNGIKAKVFNLDSNIDLALDLELKAPNGGIARGDLAVPQSMIDQYRLADFLAFLGPQVGQANNKVKYQIQQEF